MKYLSPIYCGLVGFASANHVVVSLGSSYAAGVGLQESYGAILKDLLMNYDGATSQYIQGAAPGSTLKDVPTQAQKIIANTTIITLTSGGNDIDYVGCLFNASQSSCAAPLIDQPTWTGRFNTSLDAIISRMKSAGVGCPTCVPIYVVTYPQALGVDTVCSMNNVNCTFTPTQVTQNKNLYTNFTDWTNSAFSAYKTDHSTYNLNILDMRPLSANHDVGSQVNWINGRVDMSPTNGQMWHPTKAGVNFIASAIFANNKHQPSPTPKI